MLVSYDHRVTETRPIPQVYFLKLWLFEPLITSWWLLNTGDRVWSYQTQTHHPKYAKTTGVKCVGQKTGFKNK